MRNTRKKTIFFSPLIVLAVFVCGQDIEGVWKGTLHVQSSDFPIVFHIAKDSTGQYLATFDSPSQNGFNLPVSEVIEKKDSVIMMMAMLNGKYAGILAPDGKKIDGTWFQGTAAFPLTIARTSTIAIVKQPKRPQTPKGPFEYQIKEVDYWNADKSIHFGGTLTCPMEAISSRKKSFPAIMLITGSGQQDRDETMAGHKPFAVLADNLTKKGFLVLRVDDRGIGKTTGDFNQSTSLDFAKDVEAGLNFLESLPEVNRENVGLIGHSEGALIAPLVASERKDVKFIVLLAGPGIPTIDVMEEQWKAIDVSNGHSEKEADATSGFLRLVAEEINRHLDSVVTFRNVRNRADSFARTFDTATLGAIRRRTAMTMDDYIVKAINGMNGKWFRYFISFNPEHYLRKVDCKVLALNGSKDVQMIAANNLAGIKASLQKSGSSKYDVIELPGLNHLFQTCVKCNPAEYEELEETFSSTALAVLDDWLLKNVL